MAERKRVFVSHRLPGEKLAELARQCEMSVWQGEELLSPEGLRERLRGCNGLVCLLTDRVDRALLDSVPDLEFISSMSVGVDHIDLAAATARGLPVGHTPGVLVDTTADTAFALLLAAARRVAEADRFVRAGGWRDERAWSPDFFVGKDVSGASLGIIGLGEIGQAVARRAAGFGMQVLAWNRTPRSVPGVQSVSLEELLSRCDFVSVHVALTEQTRGLLDTDRIAMMKPGSVLVNTARGGIVDEHALARALDSGAVYAAGIDVFSREPIQPDNPLLAHDRVVLAPHIGSATVLTRARMANMAVDNALSALAGEPMRHCANAAVYD